MSEHPPIPKGAVAAGWHEFTYPRAVVDGPTDAFRRGIEAAAHELWREWTRGMAVVPLPVADGSGVLWSPAGIDIMAITHRGEPRVDVNFGYSGIDWPVDVARKIFAAGLAACVRAEQLATEAVDTDA